MFVELVRAWNSHIFEYLGKRKCRRTTLSSEEIFQCLSEDLTSESTSNLESFWNPITRDTRLELSLDESERGRFLLSEHI
jgi:hypothetical protein